MNINRILFTTGIILPALLLASCAMDPLTMSVTEPAPVSVPSGIQKVGIINRSLPSDDHKKLDVIDKIFSAEGKNLDKEGAGEAVLGMLDELGKNDRFTEVRIIDSLKMKNPGLGVFPAQLSWETVRQICDAYEVDALFALSFYDTDANVEYKTAPVEIEGPLGVKVSAVEHRATITTLIKTGWRIYDPGNKLILDEYVIHEQVVSSGSGVNPAKAAEAVIGRKEAILRVSRELGYTYAMRILPYRVRVRREYYVRGTGNFKTGMRRARAGNWNGAAELWEKETGNPKRKVAGRACYNMAIINEINGNLGRAVEWASKAYSDYNNKQALDYLNVLKGRIARNERLEQQMNY